MRGFALPVIVQMIRSFYTFLICELHCVTVWVVGELPRSPTLSVMIHFLVSGRLICATAKVMKFWLNGLILGHAKRDKPLHQSALEDIYDYSI